MPPADADLDFVEDSIEVPDDTEPGSRVDLRDFPVDIDPGTAVDAVLGAAGLDDLGTLVSETDPKNRGRDSAEFCARAMELVRQKGLTVKSMDVVVETELPRLKPHRAAMRARLAELFAVEPDRVNLKGKSGEGLDSIGNKLAIRATVVALLDRA
jgi:2-C-methyl-D-erythritol 2,4-cyclodiphosphate synthase